MKLEGSTNHKEHQLTGTFDIMAAATKTSLKGLCESKKKTRNSKDGLEILLFSMSDAFKQLT